MGRLHLGEADEFAHSGTKGHSRLQSSPRSAETTEPCRAAICRQIAPVSDHIENSHVGELAQFHAIPPAS
jgi:hypothetical protein